MPPRARSAAWRLAEPHVARLGRPAAAQHAAEHVVVCPDVLQHVRDRDGIGAAVGRKARLDRLPRRLDELVPARLERAGDPVRRRGAPGGGHRAIVIRSQSTGAELAPTPRDRAMAPTYVVARHR